MRANTMETALVMPELPAAPAMMPISRPMKPPSENMKKTGTVRHFHSGSGVGSHAGSGGCVAAWRGVAGRGAVAALGFPARGAHEGTP